MFMLPGLAIALAVTAKQQLRATYVMIMVVASGSAFGSWAFWLFFFSKRAGQLFSYVVIGAALVMIGRALARDRARLMVIVKQLRLPFVYVAVVGALYLSILFGVANPFAIGQGLMDWRFFTLERPGDNIIPLLFASKIYAREPLIPFCCGDWLSSDRPPLQAGIFLLFWPFKLRGSAGLNYQLMASGLQCMWICAVWVLLTTVGAGSRRIVQVLGLLIPCTLLFYNSLYTWPKLLGASFVLFAMSIGATALLERRRLTGAEVALVALCVGLALLSHPGSLFSLPLLVFVFVWKSGVSLKQVLTFAAILGLFELPWALYQRYFDPPGNRLLKIHLAGVIPIDSRTTWQAVTDAYKSLTVRQILTNKWRNVVRMVGEEPLRGFGWQAFPFGSAGRAGVDYKELEAARVEQRETIWNALGALNLGWISALVLLLRRRAAGLPHTPEILAVGVANLLLWCLIIFGPAGTPVEHSSYADLLLVAIALSSCLLVLPRWVPLSVLALEIANLLFVWMPFRPAGRFVQVVIQWPLVGFAVLSGAVLLVFTALSWSPGHRGA